MFQQWPNPPQGEDPPHPVDVVREILREVGSLSRLMEVYYLLQEPGLLDILCGLGTLSDSERSKLMGFMRRGQQSLLRVREGPAGAITLEWQNESQLDKSA